MILTFQNCAQSENFKTAALSSLSQDSASSSNTSQSNIDNESSAQESEKNKKKRAAASTPTSAPKDSSSAAPPAASSVAETCVDYMNTLGADNFSGPLMVELNPIDNIGMSGNEPYAYMGFGIAFRGKKPVGEETYLRRFKFDTSGFVIKLKALDSNTIITMANSYFTTIPSLPSEKTNSIVYSNSNPNSPNKDIRFQVSNKFYFDNKDRLNAMRVELYCHENLVASGIQDFKRLEFPLNKKMLKTKNGYTFKDSVIGFINMSCPTEAVAGSSLRCTAGGVGLENIYWLVNGVRASEFDKNKMAQFTNVPAGVHTVQAIAVLSNGKEMRSLMYTIQIK
jgi:hypothetical protein